MIQWIGTVILAVVTLVGMVDLTLWVRARRAKSDTDATNPEPKEQRRTAA